MPLLSPSECEHYTALAASLAPASGTITDTATLQHHFAFPYIMLSEVHRRALPLPVIFHPDSPLPAIITTSAPPQNPLPNTFSLSLVTGELTRGLTPDLPAIHGLIIPTKDTVILTYPHQKDDP